MPIHIASVHQYHCLHHTGPHIFLAQLFLCWYKYSSLKMICQNASWYQLAFAIERTATYPTSVTSPQRLQALVCWLWGDREWPALLTGLYYV